MTEGQAPKTASPLQVAKAVLWAFLGIRRHAEHESDAAQLKPAHVIVAGIVGAALFVLSLVLLVRFIVGGTA